MKKMFVTIIFMVMIPFIVDAQGTSQDAVVAATNMNGTRLAPDKGHLQFEFVHI